MYVEKDSHFRLIVQDITYAEATRLCHEYEKLKKLFIGGDFTVLKKVVGQIKEIMPWVINNAE